MAGTSAWGWAKTKRKNLRSPLFRPEHPEQAYRGMAGGRAVRGFQRLKNVPAVPEHSGTGFLGDPLEAVWH